MNTVEVSLDDGLATLTLDRPEASNAVNQALRDDLIAALDAANGDHGVRAVVVTGRGRSFCAGQDLREAATMQADEVAQWQQSQRAMFQAIRLLDKPCVAAVNGAAAGAGFQIALCADLRVSHTGARLGQPEIRAGFASIVGSYLMTLHLGLSKNVELSLTGELISAAEAHRLGLVHHLVDEGDVRGRARELALTLAEQPPQAFRLSKRRFREITQAGFDEACEAGARYQEECFSTGEPQRVMAARMSRPTS
jgi:enoyl-CoA hydratase/carnithine racemase